MKVISELKDATATLRSKSVGVMRIWRCFLPTVGPQHSKAENKLYSQDFGVKSWIFLIIGISIVYVKIKLYTKFGAKMLIRSKVMID